MTNYIRSKLVRSNKKCDFSFHNINVDFSKIKVESLTSQRYDTGEVSSKTALCSFSSRETCLFVAVCIKL